MSNTTTTKNNYDYDEVQTEEDAENIGRIHLSWLIFLRQIFVVSGVWVIYFTLGLSFGAPTVLIPQMRREANSSEIVSLEMESWLSSIHGYSAVPFIIATPILAQKFGRKKPFILVCFNTLIANIVFYFSTSAVHVLISEIMQGVLLASNITFLLPVCSEYSSPHYRGIFMTIKTTCFFWGVWIANAIGTFCHWKYIGIIGIICSVYSLSAIVWPESPSWLALKGQYKEAAAAHHWLKGNDKISEKELTDLIKSQKEYNETCRNHISKNLIDKLKLVKCTITTKGYYYPLLMTMAIMSLYQFSGKMVCIMYAVQVIHQITNNQETAYLGMLLLEGITIFSMCVGCFIFKYLKRKTLLLSATSLAVISLYVIALYLYLVSLGVCYENKIVSLLLLVLFSVTISCGPLIMTASIFSEIIAFRYKCSSLIILTLYSEILMATLLKLAPSIFRTLSMHGTFLFYALCSSVFTVILLVYLPETKGRSLQEIEDSFKNDGENRDS